MTPIKKTEIVLSPALSAAIDLDGGECLILFSCSDKSFVASAFIDLARTYMFEFPADAALLIGPKSTYDINEIYSHYPGKGDPMNSAVYSKDLENGLGAPIRSGLRMDVGCILIDSQIDSEALSLCLTAVQTGHKVFVADNSGDAKTALAAMQTLIAQDKDPKLMQHVFSLTKKKIFVRDGSGQEQLIKDVDKL